MKLNRSLRKAIAAGLALTTFSTILTGCGSNRGLTTGGLSGKGIVGDFLVGGLYGGVFGGLLRPGKPLPEGAFVVELPRPNDERLLVELVGMDALRYYVHARLATEKLSRMNEKNSTPEEYEKLLRETTDLWQCADNFADMAEKLAHRLAEKETKPDYKPLAIIDNAPFDREIFFSVAHAEGWPWGDGTTGGGKPGPRGPESWGKSERVIKRGTQEWAKNIEAAYKNYPAGREIEGIAKNLQVDTRTAKKAFLEAKQVLEQEKGNQNLKAGQLYNIGAKTAMVTSVSCKTALLVCGAILTSGATGGAAVTGVVNTLASGADLVIELTNTAHEIITDKSDPTLDKIQQFTSTFAAVTSLGTIVTSLDDFALKGKDAVAATQKALKDAGLGNTTGFLDKFNIGGSGISFLTDVTSWGVDRGLELSDGKILGFKVHKNDNGQTVVIPVEMPENQTSTAQPLNQIGGETLDLWMNGGKGAPGRKMTIAELEKLVDEFKQIGQAKQQAKEDGAKEATRIKEILEEDAKRRQEIADDEARREAAKRSQNASEVAPRRSVGTPWVGLDLTGQRRHASEKTEQRRTEETAFTPSKMAGYYTVTTSNGDMAMRVVLKATGDNTLRVIEVQQRTDKKGKGKFTITIDPKTGKGKTDKGHTVRFEVKMDGAAYMGTMVDGSRTWRFVKH